MSTNEASAHGHGAHDEFDGILQGVIDALEPLGFESYVIDWSGGEPCTSLDLGDGRCLDVTVKLRATCGCCDLDGTHHHERCDHPCCPDDDEDAGE